ncbi:peptidase domain-containing ABC transporter [Wenyingzhuangia marina]|uniref:ABC-type bacteriocin/lantibiotic exporter, contains an N-terminal double-glycine peptidase domain n=1 Tax=Wenyingzhuangia marina TaxID=1195760 RepID=A0A1M5UL09_9FLAO|nr:ABC transporter ATP-binding protein [Wenyingzhuangia marina]SHH63704.1 ABC-type bacteriocin/lantibiotic exporter, contains an N-terminal double-glycine peptidase domain [Wenyingzhuangia marina]
MTISPLVRFWNLIKPYKKPIRLIYYYAIISGVVNLSLPLGIQAIINYLQTGELTTSWIVLVAFVLTGIAISGKIQINQLRIVENIQQDIFAKSAFEFAYRIPKIKQINLDKVHAPELVNRFFDVLTIQKGLPKILIDFSMAAFQIVFGLVLLTFYSSYFIMLGISLILIIYLIFKITGPKGLETSIKESKYKYMLAHWLEEIASNTKTFKVLNKGNLHLNKTDDVNLHYLENREKHFKILIKQFVLFVGFKVWVAAGLLVLGGVLVFNQQMNIGQFVASEIIIIMIINSVEKITRIVETIYDVLTALDKIGHVTDLDLDEDNGVGELENSPNGVSIELNDLSFKYPNQENYVFENLSVKIKPKSKVWLKGNTGKGKSTLLNIIARIQTIENGHVLFNNRPSDYYSLESLHDQIGFISPNTGLFEGTIEENIMLNREIDPEQLKTVLDKLFLTDYISKLKKGINTKVDSRGRRMPKSTAQKIVLARYLVNNPSVLLLEDPLQFIDETEKKAIIDYIMDEQKSWTVIVVADYLYWADKANQIIKL